MLEDLGITGLAARFEYAAANYGGMLLIFAWALPKLIKRRSKGRGGGVFMAALSAAWFIAMCVPLINIVSYLSCRKSGDSIYAADEDKAAELFEQADKHFALAEKQAAFIGAVFFTLSALALIFLGVRAFRRSAELNRKLSGALYAAVNITAAGGLLIFGFICTAKFLSAAGLV